MAENISIKYRDRNDSIVDKHDLKISANYFKKMTSLDQLWDFIVEHANSYSIPDWFSGTIFAEAGIFDHLMFMKHQNILDVDTNLDVGMTLVRFQK